MDVDEDKLRNREVKDHLVLAQKYLEAADSSLADGKYRVAVYIAYNAVESSRKRPLPWDRPGPHRRR